MSAPSPSAKNHLDETHYRAPGQWRQVMTTRQLRETLLYTGGDVIGAPKPDVEPALPTSAGSNVISTSGRKCSAFTVVHVSFGQVFAQPRYSALDVL